MDTKKCTEFLENAKTAYFSPRDIKKEYWDKIDEIIKRLQMWEDFKEKYNGYYLMVSQSARGLNHLMEKFEKEYFSKQKSRWQRINDILEVLNTVGVSPDRKELVNLLIELRDEELEGSD